VEEVRPGFVLEKDQVIAEATLLVTWGDLIKIMKRNGLADVTKIRSEETYVIFVTGRLIPPLGLVGGAVVKWRRGVVCKLYDEAHRVRLDSLSSRRRARAGSWR